ncbi:MAG: 2-isopropylmalate synthase [Actinomycetia bacterium]|nr:2-isopropylmalate synthase [Actinomycetes bacterium]MCP4961396.1 2-isopropylmalate synthase [Actinomycetes bacterium]
MEDEESIQSKERRYLYDWNLVGNITKPDFVELNDETLRDGLQGPSVRQPTLDEKLEILHRMNDLGIHAANVGYAAASPEVLDHVVALAEEIEREKLSPAPNCAGRTHASDILPIAEAQQRSGVKIQAALFLGSSPIRQYVEGWDVDFLVRSAHESVTLATEHDLDVMFVTEDTTRAPADVLHRVYTAAIEAGARRICLADTVGHATPWGVEALVTFAKYLVAASGEDVAIDWHGHRDRNLGVVNSLAALSAGATRIHACGLGIGERSGNTPMDTLLVNLKLLNWIDVDLRGLPAYCEAISLATDTPIPTNTPAIGKDAFETGTGVHAAAVLKALKTGDSWLANRIYSGVPADELGREQEITVGPMSGKANVVAWLSKRDLPYDDTSVERVLAVAKASDHVLCREEIETALWSESTT